MLGDFLEGGDAFLAVVAFVSDGGDVGPAESLHHVDERLSLVGIRGNHAGEEAKPGLVAQLYPRARVADLGDLKQKQKQK